MAKTFQNCQFLYKSNLFALFIAFVMGSLLPLAFTPFDVYLLAIMSPAILLWLWIGVSGKKAFLRGWVFGLGYFGVGVSWVYVSLHVYGYAPVSLAILITLLLVMYLALFPALQGYLLARFFLHDHSALLKPAGILKLSLLFPASWVIFELLRSWILTGFPWLLLGYSQVNSPLRGFAPIFGVYGLSFIACLNAVALAVIIFQWCTKKAIVFVMATLVVILWFSGAFLAEIHWTQPYGNKIKVALLQGNIPQELKWQPEQLPNILENYRKLTDKQWNNNIIIWPEAAIPASQIQVGNFIDKLRLTAKQRHATVITGIAIAEAQNVWHYYNGIIVLGNAEGQYLKRHLVVFGEFLPLRAFLNWLNKYIQIPMSDFSVGPYYQEDIVVNGVTIAPFICYEIALPRLALDYLPRANVLLTLSDDSWFGKSIALAQHLEMAQMRSLETGRPQLVSTNTGTTAIIDAAGEIVKQAPSFVESILNGEVQPMIGETPLVKMFGRHNR